MTDGQTLCTGQEGLNHLIECFYEECEVSQTSYPLIDA
jgi:hypothetical protein